MEAIVNLLESLVPTDFDAEAFLKGALVVCAGTFLLSIIGRLFFGKKSTLNHSVSSAISILFIYVITIVVYSFGVNLTFLLSPLPFISISGDYLSIFVFEGAHYTETCSQLLSMIILAFLANLADSWLPQGKHLISWFFFRCLSVLLAMILHLIANALLTSLLPEGLLTWAPVILLAILFVTLFMGVLKLILGALLASVNPALGIFATFFFSNVIGKQISRAVLTTLLMAAMIWLLNYLDCTVIFIASSALAAYIPFLILLLVIWYVVSHLF